MARRRAFPGTPAEPQEATQETATVLDDETVLLTRATFLYGRLHPSNELVIVPSKIANVLRAKGLCK